MYHDIFTQIYVFLYQKNDSYNEAHFSHIIYDLIQKIKENPQCVSKENCDKQKEYPYVRRQYIGVLPQGAPTSPMLSNLAARKLDESLYEFAQKTDSFTQDMPMT